MYPNSKYLPIYKELYLEKQLRSEDECDTKCNGNVPKRIFSNSWSMCDGGKHCIFEGLGEYTLPRQEKNINDS